MYGHILIATDGSELANSGVTQGLDLAQALGAKVTFLSVTDVEHGLVLGGESLPELSTRHDEEAAAAAAKILQAACDQAAALGVPAESVSLSNDLPYEAIVTTASARGCDLIAMASHGRRGFAAMLLGSQTREVLVRSTVPVLVFR